MDTVKGLTLWLAPPTLASLVCTAAANIAYGGHLTDWRPVVGLAPLTLIFTVGGSTMLCLVFGALERHLIVTRYVALVTLGAVAGAAVMIPFGTSVAVAAGFAYGLVTACFWVGCHRAIYGSR